MSAKLVMKQVSKTYGDGDSVMSVLHNLDLEVNEGEFVAVLGPSGSGKSTFLSAAGALLTPTSGEIFIDGESLTNKDKGELTELRLQKIGFMFQALNCCLT
ncbi:ABC-type lipoprotein export system ATPase subunit [Paenibacillus wynnii]|nr:ABC-type lipoprotein export system ATPase subunit [Paenibacillus wynnii]